MSVFHTLQFIANHPLNQGHRSAALFRFLKWQVRARLKSGPIVVPWVENTRMLVRRGDMGFTQNIYCGLHDFPEMVLRSFLCCPDQRWHGTTSPILRNYCTKCNIQRGARKLAVFTRTRRSICAEMLAIRLEA